jgi:hypothetical protein
MGRVALSHLRFFFPRRLRLPVQPNALIVPTRCRVLDPQIPRRNLKIRHVRLTDNLAIVPARRAHSKNSSRRPLVTFYFQRRPRGDRTQSTPPHQARPAQPSVPLRPHATPPTPRPTLPTLQPDRRAGPAVRYPHHHLPSRRRQSKPSNQFPTLRSRRSENHQKITIDQ